MKELSGKKVVVVGAGKSGVAAADLLVTQNADVILYDENETIDRDRINGQLKDASKVTLLLGKMTKDIVGKTDLLVLSPGVPVDTEFVGQFCSQGAEVWGEIELAYRCSHGRLAAITGTNGKTTTTSLVGKMICDYFGSGFVVGNIGNPYTETATETTNDSVTVAEISSFQLETAIEFHPQVSAILNITPDHMNRHHTMENYIAIKKSITKNQTEEDLCVLNYEDEYTRLIGKEIKARVLYFSVERKLDYGFYQEQEAIYFADGENVTRIMGIHDMLLLGRHNVENVMAALGVGYGLNIPMDSLVKTVKEFKAVEHRIEFVKSVKGVDYYNDSKGTNPDAAIKGIQAMNRPTILIGGGYDKGSTYDEWIEAFDGKVKRLVLIGQTKEKIADCARAHGFQNIVFADSLEEVVQICAREAVSGDAVLLSPACASWGMFPNYEVRGKIFKEYVNQLEE